MYQYIHLFLICYFIFKKTKICLVKAMVFPVVRYGCESWTIKKSECWRIHAFELWCWRRLMRVPWTARRSNQSILKEISPEYSLEGLMLKLKLQYLGHLIRRADSLEKTLMLGKIEGERRRGGDGWMALPTRWTQVWVSPGSWWWTGRPGMLQTMGCKESDTTEGLKWFKKKDSFSFLHSCFHLLLPILTAPFMLFLMTISHSPFDHSFQPIISSLSFPGELCLWSTYFFKLPSFTFLFGGQSILTCYT